ncbi:hypothetical protein ACRALDRAFT_206087 [Sodiomyces alcalophilus JCM 7366]|uniref:uncharacterized protein n=1 Tax=Sodiomyces alcalophilus JCM 7366 TaxID=591952 RepID=UPI0039B42240
MEMTQPAVPRSPFLVHFRREEIRVVLSLKEHRQVSLQSWKSDKAVSIDGQTKRPSWTSRKDDGSSNDVVDSVYGGIIVGEHEEAWHPWSMSVSDPEKDDIAKPGGSLSPVMIGPFTSQDKTAQNLTAVSTHMPLTIVLLFNDLISFQPAEAIGRGAEMSSYRLCFRDLDLDRNTLVPPCQKPIIGLEPAEIRGDSVPWSPYLSCFFGHIARGIIQSDTRRSRMSFQGLQDFYGRGGA